MFVQGRSYSEEITVVATGTSLGAVYTCGHCPSEYGGGLSRRATLIKDIRSQNKNVLLVDAGFNFAGGIYDPDSQGKTMDRIRSAYFYQAFKLMDYDVLGLSPQEFLYGVKFLETLLSQAGMNAVLSTIPERENIKPVIVKDVGGVKARIVCLANLENMPFDDDLKLEKIEVLAGKLFADEKSEQFDVNIVLSSLQDKDLKDVLDTYGGKIDLVVSSSPEFYLERFEDYKGTPIMRTSHQGKSLQTIKIKVKDKRVTYSDYRERLISRDIAEDKEVQDSLPRCFRNDQCEKEGLYGICYRPGSADSFCQYVEASPVEFIVVMPHECITCDVEGTYERIKQLVLGIQKKEIKDTSALGKALLDEFYVKLLPAYFLATAVKDDLGFNRIKPFLTEGKDYYQVIPQLAGGSYFRGRERMPGRLDVFFSLLGRNVDHLLNLLKDFTKAEPDIEVRLHFLVQREGQDFKVPSGMQLELEENLRSSCVYRKYPDKIIDYLVCRRKNILSSWWDDCLLECGIPYDQIKKCAQSDEGSALLGEYSVLGNTLNISRGPYILLENQEIFGINDRTPVEDLIKIVEKAKRR